MNINQSVNVSFLENEIEPLSDSSFLSIESIAIAKRILKNEPLHKEGSFEDDKWIFYRKLDSRGLTRNFNFKDLHINDSLVKIPNFKEIVKCWIAELIEKFVITTVGSYYTTLLLFLNQTNGLDPDAVDNFEYWLSSTKTISNKYKQLIIYSALNFFDYSDINVGEIYIPTLINLKKKIKIKKEISVLPPSHEILCFSKCVEDYYEEIITDNSFDRKAIFFLPIIIWWKLTTVIPLRPSEFCDIERFCLFDEDGKYFIRLPRHKYPKNHPNVIDSIQIDKKLYEIIKMYIRKTDSYGHTETLISYNSILKTSTGMARKTREWRKYNKDIFNYSQLSFLLHDFYTNIVYEKYGYSIKNSNRLKLNDSRHIAIFSLMMQGISPVEIARLANHRTISMQMNYANHTEYWIDSEVFAILQKFKFTQSASVTQNALMRNSNGCLKLASHIPNEIKIKALRPPTTPNCKKPLKEIGYCSDDEQRCETEDCIFCDHWRSSIEDLIKKKKIIKEKLSKSKRDIDELIIFIRNLHSIMLSDEISRSHPINLTKLKSTSFQIKESINKIVDLKILEAVNNE